MSYLELFVFNIISGSFACLKLSVNSKTAVCIETQTQMWDLGTLVKYIMLRIDLTL